MACTLGKEHVCCTRIENLSVKAGKETILNNVNLHLHCGELTAVVGRNGAGKSTFIKALLNVIPHSGKIVFESERSSEKYNTKIPRKYYKTTKPKFGYVPQSLFIEQGSPISVEDLVRSCTSKKPIWIKPNTKEKNRIKEILSHTNSQNLVQRRLCDLSGGELQRVMLALAISPIPDILLLDEPVSGVDRQGLQTFYDLVSSLRRNHDITIILVSHDLDLVAKHADRVIFINNKDATVGSVNEVFNSTEFIETFGHIQFES